MAGREMRAVLRNILIVVLVAITCPVPYKPPSFGHMPRFPDGFSFLKPQRIPPAPVRPYRWLHEDERRRGR
jgi:hypothetical protein